MQINTLLFIIHKIVNVIYKKQLMKYNFCWRELMN